MANLTPRNNAKPPEKGVFPLDHFAECKHLADKYLSCVEAKEGDTQPCIYLSKAYLQCRMEKSLMAKQDLKELGIEEVRVSQQQVDKSREQL
mmetsp:Transcript_10055/g.26070  ORF Transcript_10055/g.26070 Transcript_10055/m.26070 type:complete len:92 (-) Transcript_10055:612-887(-)|eukprot:CAMPEP_0202350652 /NCGR_PEP_ID=MMETSP1126-20121109/7636_1 /ASSEMBLY_ACC=CAM_ASM_000457 /TAXON_ID=3047 /ORGANISM="Dunaliella tertiolecta, Strain CCMP1320" /LENGTH=91 /DNA_ID=CAMNT_0048942661 /DNA_START=81 /DNA_END=356 /DNA_ORIENTATION=+